MANVTREVAARAEHFLTYSLREWAAVPDYVAEFPAWDEIEQLAFVHEWAIRESGLHVLKEYAEQDLLTVAQRVQYDRLLNLVARNRPIIEPILED